jgi:hypothetical protein
MNYTNKTTEFLLDASKEVRLEVKAEKTMHMLSHNQKAGQNHNINIAPYYAHILFSTLISSTFMHGSKHFLSINDMGCFRSLLGAPLRERLQNKDIKSTGNVEMTFKQNP